MIQLSKLNEQIFLLNCDLIETVTATPDTTIKLTTGNLYIVKETLSEVAQKVIEFKREALKTITDNNKN